MRRVLIIGVLACLVAPAAEAAAKKRPPTAVVSRTAYGIAHVKAGTYRGAGFGVAYAQAQDNLCVLADQYLTVQARRSLHKGADGTYFSAGNGRTINNLKSDLFWQRIIDDRTVEKLLEKPPPLGPSRAGKAMVEGFAAGYNRWLRKIGGPAGIKDPACRGEEWVRPITAIDVWRRGYSAVGLASFQYMTEPIVDAAPPAGLGVPPAFRGTPGDARQLREALPPHNLRIGSNAVALGRDAVQGGKTGMMLGNPHFPWQGPERFWEFQVTIPGKLDVIGGSLLGLPIINIGHTRGVAWSHTVSTAYRFTPFELTLVPGDPTSYLVDGKPEKMTTQTVKVPLPDGQEASHTFYFSRYGPIMAFADAFMFWTPLNAYALGDANADNLRILDTFLAMNRAQSVEDIRKAQQRWQAIPWVNTIAADRAGNAYYADESVVPNVPDDLVAACATSPLARAVYELAALPVLDGSRSACAWRTDPDAVVPGIFGPGKLPRLTRSDYATNHNDSYWLSNPQQPLEGFARIIGDERTQRSLRTRLGLKMVEQRLAGSDGLPGRGFTLGRLRTVAFNDRFHSGELFRDQVVGMCRSMSAAAAACDALERWDLHANLDSRGTLLWQEFFGRLGSNNTGPYADAFDPTDPVNTPRQLDTNNPEVRQALSDAIAHLESKGIAFDARWGDVQYVERNGERIPVHGCQGAWSIEIGCFNLMATESRDDGTLEPVHASSFVQATTWKGAKVISRSILTYSQASDPTSPWHADQTKMFSGKRWVRDRFTPREIKADPQLQVTTLRE